MRQSSQSVAADTPVLPWDFSEIRGISIHINFPGPKHGFMWLIVIDTMVESHSVKGGTVHALLDLVSTFGILSQIVLDNSPQFAGEEFQN